MTDVCTAMNSTIIKYVLQLIFLLLLNSLLLPRSDATILSYDCSLKLLNDYSKVPDSAFNATSYFVQSSARDFSPKAARMSFDSENREFAWCPKYEVKTSLKEYLEIDLGSLTLIKVIQTKGRFAEGAGKEFTPYYQIKYLRESSLNNDYADAYYSNYWRDYRKILDNNDRSSILNGPTDSYLDKFENLDPPIITNRIRIFPYSPKTPKRVCLKLQLFGCDYNYNLLEYNMPQGSIFYPRDTNSVQKNYQLIKNKFLTFQDQTYDGYRNMDTDSYTEYLSNGLGILTDGVIGDTLSDEVIQTIKDSVIKRNHYSNKYVGWNKLKLLKGKSFVEIKMIFKNKRNFSSVRIFGMKNKFYKMGYASEIELYFSDSESLNDRSDTNNNQRKLIKSNIINLFNVETNSLFINLDGNSGKFVTIKLFFSDLWLLLSEIAFKSTDAIYTGSSLPNKEQSANKLPSQSKFSIASKPILFNTATTQSTTANGNSSLKFATSQKPQSASKHTTGIEAIYILSILLCLLLGLVTAICAFWFVLIRKRSHARESIKKQALALNSNGQLFAQTSPCSNGAFIIPYNQPPVKANNNNILHRTNHHNSSSIQCFNTLPQSQVGPPLPGPPSQSQSNHHLANYHSSFNTDMVNYVQNETMRPIGAFLNNNNNSHSNNNNCSLDASQLLLKHSSINDNNIYTSIMGSDNDSTLSPEYASTSVTNEMSRSRTPMMVYNQSEDSRVTPTQGYLPTPLEPVRPGVYSNKHPSIVASYHLSCDILPDHSNKPWSSHSAMPPQLPPPQLSSSSSVHNSSFSNSTSSSSNSHLHFLQQQPQQQNINNVPYQLSFNDFTQDINTLHNTTQFDHLSHQTRVDSYI